MRTPVALGVCAVGAALVACGSSGSGSSPSPSSSAAAAAVCQSKQQIQTALDDMRNATVQTATVGQFRSDLQTISNALNQLAASRGAVSQARVNDVHGAVASLQETLQSPLPTGVPLADVQAEINAQTAAVRAATSALFATVPC